MEFEIQQAIKHRQQLNREMRCKCFLTGVIDVSEPVEMSFEELGKSIGFYKDVEIENQAAKP
jgi:hypothetical protein